MKPSISYEELLRAKLVEAAATMMASEHTTQPLTPAEESVCLRIVSDNDSIKEHARLAQAKLNAHNGLNTSPLLQVQALRYQRLQDLGAELNGLSGQQLKQFGHVGLSSLWADAMFAIRRDSLKIALQGHSQRELLLKEALQCLEDEDNAHVGLAVDRLEGALFNDERKSKAKKGSQADYTQHIKWQYYWQHKVHQVEIEASLGSKHPIIDRVEQPSGHAARTLDQTQQALAMVMSAFAEDVNNKYKKEISRNLRSTLPGGGGDSGTLSKAAESKRWLQVMMLAARAYQRSLPSVNGEVGAKECDEEKKQDDLSLIEVTRAVAAQEVIMANSGMLSLELPGLFPAAVWDEGEVQEKEQRCMMAVFDAFNQHDQGRGDYLEVLTELANLIKDEMNADFLAKRGKEPKAAKRVLKSFKGTLQRLHASMQEEHSESQYVLNTIQQAGSGAQLSLAAAASEWLASTSTSTSTSTSAFAALQICLETKMATLNTEDVREFARFKTCLDYLTGVMVKLYQKQAEGLDSVFFDHIHQQVEAQLKQLSVPSALPPLSVAETAVFSARLESLIHLARYMTIRLEFVRDAEVQPLLRQAYLEKFIDVRVVEDTTDLPLGDLSRVDKAEIGRVEQALKEILRKKFQLGEHGENKKKKYNGKGAYARWSEETIKDAAAKLLDDKESSFERKVTKQAMGAQLKITTIDRLLGLVQAEQNHFTGILACSLFDDDIGIADDSGERCRSAVFRTAAGNALNVLTARLDEIKVSSKTKGTLDRWMTELHKQFETFEENDRRALQDRSDGELGRRENRRSSIVYQSSSPEEKRESSDDELDACGKVVTLHGGSGEGEGESPTQSLLPGKKGGGGSGFGEQRFSTVPTPPPLPGKKGGGGEGVGESPSRLEPEKKVGSGSGFGEQRLPTVPTPPPLPEKKGGGSSPQIPAPPPLPEQPTAGVGEGGSQKKGKKPEGGVGQRKADFISHLARLRAGAEEGQSGVMLAAKLRPVKERELAPIPTTEPTPLDGLLKKTEALRRGGDSSSGESDGGWSSDDEGNPLVEKTHRPVQTARVVTKGTVGVKAKQEAKKQGGKADAKRANVKALREGLFGGGRPTRSGATSTAAKKKAPAPPRPPGKKKAPPPPPPQVGVAVKQGDAKSSGRIDMFAAINARRQDYGSETSDSKACDSSMKSGKGV